MRRRSGARALVVVAAVLAGLATTSCGGDPDDGYCDTLREEAQVLGDLAERADTGDGEDSDVVGPTLESLRRLADEAPAELEDEYATLVYAWEGLDEAVEETGLQPAQLEPGRVPDGVDRRAVRRLRQTARAMLSARVTDAAAGIEDHASQVCDVELDV